MSQTGKGRVWQITITSTVDLCRCLLYIAVAIFVYLLLSNTLLPDFYVNWYKLPLHSEFLTRLTITKLAKVDEYGQQKH